MPLRKLLAVRPKSTNYVSYYEVHTAKSFQEAQAMIAAAEAEGAPFDDLDLPANDPPALWAFVDWMEARGTRYAFSIFDYCSIFDFIHVRDEARRRGFHFNS